MNENLDNIAVDWKDGMEIPHFQVIEHPTIFEYIKKYPQCFAYSVNNDSWIYKRNGNAE